MNDSPNNKNPLWIDGDAFQYQVPFLEEVAAIRGLVLDPSFPKNAAKFDQFESMIGIKSSSRLLSFENQRFRSFLHNDKSAVGLLFSQKLASNLSKISETTDTLILDGVNSILLEHVGSGRDGRPCTFITKKCRLDDLRNPDYTILIISRPLLYIGSEDAGRNHSLAELLSLIQQLDTIDQNICRGLAMGDPIKEIANRVGLTTRSVENRKQKVMKVFGFSRPIEIVKMLVRLEENGLYR